MAEQHISPTWQPPSQDEDSSGTLDAAERNELPASAFAFPAQHKEPLTSASHVRSALSRFDQVQDATDAGRASAVENIRRAASCYRFPRRRTCPLGVLIGNHSRPIGGLNGEAGAKILTTHASAGAEMRETEYRGVTRP
jgi:hypothetical protein